MRKFKITFGADVVFDNNNPDNFYKLSGDALHSLEEIIRNELATTNHGAAIDYTAGYIQVESVKTRFTKSVIVSADTKSEAIFTAREKVLILNKIPGVSDLIWEVESVTESRFG